MRRLRDIRRAASALLGAALLAGGAGFLAGGPAGAEGNDFTATCQPDGTYLVVVNYDTFVAESTIVGGVATLSNAYSGTVPMSPTYLPNVDDVSTGSKSIPGTTSGSLQIVVQLDSPNGSSSGSTTLELAGDCVALSPDAGINPSGDPAVAGDVADAAPARAVVSVPRSAG